MSRVCQLLGKRTKSGNNRPFSLKATKRTFRPNLFKRRIVDPVTGKMVTMTLSAKAIRTLKKWSREAGGCQTEAKGTEKVSEAGTGKHVKEKKLTPKQKKEEAAKKEAEALGKEEVAEEKK